MSCTSNRWESIVLGIACEQCGEQHFIAVNRTDWQDYLDGKLAQDAFPYLQADNRELIISKICDKCFNKIFEN